MATKPAVAVVIAPSASTTPAPRTITLIVTDPAIIAEIDRWTNGENYTFNVNRTTENTFKVNEAFAAEPEEAEIEEAPEAKSENPAIAALLRK